MRPVSTRVATDRGRRARVKAADFWPRKWKSWGMTYAADDFPAIWARMRELRLSRTEGSESNNDLAPMEKRPLLVDNPSTPPTIRRFLLKYGRAVGKS
jgi:hypothetical protein